MGRLLAIVGATAALLLTGLPVAHAEEGWTVDRVRFESIDSNGNSNAFTVEGAHTYRGAIEVLNVNGSLVVVNEVPLDEYMYGVSEVPASWPIEVQKAQAIAARTYLLHQMRRPRPDGTHICSTQSCQVYTGLARGERERVDTTTWRRAVDATRNHVLLYQGAPILAKYSSSNGGRSVAGGYPYLPAVDDPDDAHSPLHRWQTSTTLAELASVFSLGGQLAWVRSAGTLVELTEQQADGQRVQHHLVPGDFRARINTALPALDGLPSRVPSPRFTVWTEQDSDIVRVEGRGWGHGVGMSQYGALGKALRGMRAEDILASYYAGLRPSAIQPEALPATVRVAVQTDVVDTAIDGQRFRVIDGRATPLAHIATGGAGGWRLRPAPNGAVSVIPPAAQAGPPRLEALGVDIDPMGGVATVHLRLGAPAMVAVDGGAPVPAAAGDLTVTVPTPEPGEYTITVVASAGADRQTTLPVTFRWTGLSPEAVPDLGPFGAPAPTLPSPTLTGATLALLIATAATGRAWRRRIH